jgi:DNA-binding protein HU-beta
MIIKTKVGVLEHEPRRLNGEDNDEICGATHLTEQGGVSKKTAGEFFEAFTTLAYKEAKNTFTIPGIGKLVLANRKARVGRNPQTGETIKIAARRVVKFRVAKAAKDVVLGKR